MFFPVMMVLLDIEKQNLLARLKSKTNLDLKFSQDCNALSRDSLIYYYMLHAKNKSHQLINNGTVLIFILFEKDTPAFFRVHIKQFSTIYFDYCLEAKSASEVVDMLKYFNLDVPKALEKTLRDFTFIINSGTKITT